MPRSSYVYTFLCFAVSLSAQAKPLADFWLELDTPQPLCDAPVTLQIASEAFFPIANDIPEKDEFNDLVTDFRKKEWSNFDFGVKEFLLKYDSSPLRQVVTYLSIFSQYERLDSKDELAEKKTEKNFRQTLILYPKSKFAPVVYAATGQYYLRTGQLQRAMEHYRGARETYPDSEYKCMLTLGYLESSYLSHEWKELDSAAEKIQKECPNSRIQAMTELRVAGAKFYREENSKPTVLEKVVSKDYPFAERFVPTVFYNIGEKYYQRRQYKEAKHFFDEFLRVSPKDTECDPYAQKRIADLAFYLGEKKETVVGKYLEVFEKFPNSDEGKFSKAHALFLSANLENENELKRRFQWVDDIADTIKDENKKFRVYLEKGLLQWMNGSIEALTYLERLQNRNVIDIKIGDTGSVIRKQWVKYWKQYGLNNPQSLDIVSQYEHQYIYWIQGHPAEDDWARAYYGRLLVETATYGFKHNPTKTFQMLEEASQSKTFPLSELSHFAKLQIQRELTHWMVTDLKDASLLVLSNRKLVETILGEDAQLPLSLAESTVMPESRSIASESAPKQVEKEWTDESRMAYARIWMTQGKMDLARRALSSIKSGFQKEIIDSFIEIDMKEKQYTKAFNRMESQVSDKAAPEMNKNWIVKMSALAQDNKWAKESLKVAELSQKVLKDEVLTAELFLNSAKLFMETKNLDFAIKYFEESLKLKIQGPLEAESRFKLGQAYSAKHKKDLAIAQWEKVVESKDPNWASLAENELKLAKSNP